MVRLHFQETSWDRYLALGYSAVIATALLALNVGNLLMIPLVLFVPGYVLVAALLTGSLVPEKRDLGREIGEGTLAMVPRYSWGSGARDIVALYDGFLPGG